MMRIAFLLLLSSGIVYADSVPTPRPEPQKPAKQSGPFVWVRIPGSTQIALWQSGKQLGNWVNGSYFCKSGSEWSQADCPCTPPSGQPSYATTVMQQGCANGQCSAAGECGSGSCNQGGSCASGDCGQQGQRGRFFGGGFRGRGGFGGGLRGGCSGGSCGKGG